MRCREVGLAHFFCRPEAPSTSMADPTEQEIQQQLSELDPDIDLVALEKPRNDVLRLFIDHPDGVDLALCERVTKHFSTC